MGPRRRRLLKSTGFQSFDGSGVAISAAGRVAFTAFPQSSGRGVFTGPDPVADAVLRTDDVIPGWGRVTGISIMREAINDSGEVAMTVLFLDGNVRKAAIIRADPPNTPPTASDGTATVTAGDSVSGTLSATDPDNEPLTFALVTSAAKGTVEITAPATGAYTYTAGAVGDDTFTFKATDIRGLESNVATVTISIASPTACAVDVTSSIQSVKGRGSKNTSATQSVSLVNASVNAITGPVSLALDLLTAGVTLVNAAGVTACAPPTGSPYVDVNVGEDGVWSPGERVDVVLQFAFPD